MATERRRTPTTTTRTRGTARAAAPIENAHPSAKRGRPVAPVWHAPAALAAGLPSNPKGWVETLSAWVTEAGTFTAVAAQHGVPLRTLMRWIAWLRAKHPELATGLPTVAAGGHRPGHEGAPRGRKKKVVTAPAD